MKKLMATIATAGMAIAFIATASTTTHAKGYGMAGCGLGAIVIGPKPGIIQVVAATLNATSASQTFGITTGTSECKADGVIKAELEQRAYMAQNMQSLEVEVSRGEGEKLSSMAHLMGCSNDSMTRFGEVVQKDYDNIFNAKEDGSDWVLYRMKQTVAADSELAQSCSKVWL